MMHLFTNYFGLHGMVHVRHLSHEDFTCGYIFKGYYRLLSGPDVLVLKTGFPCTVPAYADSHFVSLLTRSKLVNPFPRISQPKMKKIKLTLYPVPVML